MATRRRDSGIPEAPDWQDDSGKCGTACDRARSQSYQAVSGRWHGHVTGGAQGGRPEGHRLLDDKREEIIRTTISRYYLTRSRPTVSQLVRDVQTNCISAGLKPPHRRTINARLEEIDLQKRAKRRGENEIVKQTQAVPGVFAASRPYMRSVKRELYLGRHFSTYGDYGIHGLNPIGHLYLPAAVVLMGV
ncbi:hypothetical protein [Sinorhizobium meliloti]|uniref:hypothetical protein n=1 Tax=Rhizobium meliloti TaxID=382 RepID=UPI001F26E1E9|nr:hypothetical protein [Sinorhizobium meliloti]